MNDYFSTERLKADLKKHAIRGAGATVFAQFCDYFIQMAGTVVLARILTPNDFGLVAMVLAVYVFFRMVRNFGLLDATVQREEINHIQVSTLFWINIGFCTAISLLFIALGPLLAWFYNEQRLQAITTVLSLDFFFGGLSTQHRALLKRNLQMYKWSGNEIAATLASFVIAIAMALSGWNYWALVARNVAWAASQAAGAWILCGWRPGLPSLKSEVMPMLKFGVNMIANHFVSYLSENVDKILVGRFYGAEALGFYHRAYHLFLAPAEQLTVPLTGVAVAALSRLSSDLDRYRRYFLKALSITSFIGFPISAMLALLGRDIILMLLGPQWKEAGDIFTVFAFGVGAQLLYATPGWLHISIGRTDRWLRWNLFSSIVGITFFFIALRFGPIMMAASYVTSLYILLGPSLWYAGKPVNLKLGTIFSVIWRYCVSSFCAGLLVWVLQYVYLPTAGFFSELNVFLRVALSSICFCGWYLIFVVMLFRNTKPLTEFWSVLKEMIPYKEKFVGPSDLTS